MDPFDTSVAHPARRYNYWLGGTDHFGRPGIGRTSSRGPAAADVAIYGAVRRLI